MDCFPLINELKLEDNARVILFLQKKNTFAIGMQEQKTSCVAAIPPIKIKVTQGKGAETFDKDDLIAILILPQNNNDQLQTPREIHWDLKGLHIKYAAVMSEFILPPRMFSGCSELEKIYFKEKISIPNGCFDNCRKLTEINFMKGCEKLGALAFAHCEIPRLILNKNNTSCEIDPSAFAYSKINEIISEGYINNDIGLFKNNEENLHTLVYLYPNDLSELTDELFSQNNLTVSEINSHAAASANIAELKLTYVKKIGDYAFSNCSHLKKAILGTNTENLIIGNRAFNECIELKMLEMPTVTELGDFAFSNCKNLDYAGPTDILWKLGEGCFSECESLIEIDLPNVYYLNDSTFYHCENLQKITCKHLELIGKSCFSGCINLKKANWPNLVTLFEYGLFDCPKELITDKLKCDNESITYNDERLQKTEEQFKTYFCKIQEDLKKFGITIKPLEADGYYDKFKRGVKNYLEDENCSAYFSEDEKDETKKLDNWFIVRCPSISTEEDLQYRPIQNYKELCESRITAKDEKETMKTLLENTIFENLIYFRSN